MKKSEEIYSLLKENKVIGVLTPMTVEDCLKAHEIFKPLGITLEIAFRSEFTLKGIRAVLEEYPEALILAGTVMTRRQANEAIKAGVVGVVSADYIPEVVEVCVRNDIMCVPGGLCDAGKQLVQKAELYGCEFWELREKYPYQWIYKLFPTITKSRSNVDIASAWKGPFKGLTIVYTGGISSKNLKEVASADPDGIFCGSALTKPIDNPNKMKEKAESWLSIIQGIKEDGR